MASDLTSDEVKQIAHLACIPLSEKEIQTFTPQLSSVLDYFSKLEEVDTSDIEPTFSTTGDTNRFQELKIGTQTLNQKDVLRNAPKKKGGYVVTKGVLDK